jgi:hypothetical protein
MMNRKLFLSLYRRKISFVLPPPPPPGPQLEYAQRVRNGIENARKGSVVVWPRNNVSSSAAINERFTEVLSSVTALYRKQLPVVVLARRKPNKHRCLRVRAAVNIVRAAHVCNDLKIEVLTY